jgi:hypothetical protein
MNVFQNALVSFPRISLANVFQNALDSFPRISLANVTRERLLGKFFALLITGPRVLLANGERPLNNAVEKQYGGV